MVKFYLIFLKHVKLSNLKSQISIENLKFQRFHISKKKIYNITNSTFFVAKFNFFT